MKKPTILILGMLFGTVFMARHLFSYERMIPEETPTGIEQAAIEIEVYPNPSDGRFQLTFEYSGTEKVSAKVFDITGKQVKDISEDLVITETAVTAQVDLDSPNSGIYFIRISWGKTLLTKKIIIR